MSDRLRLTIVTPVYNDWEAFEILLGEIDQAIGSENLSLRVQAVNDGSRDAIPQHLETRPKLAHLDSVEVVNLACNMGHQRAIAVGLAVASLDDWAEAVLVMDSDGEDRPEDIKLLLRMFRESPASLVVAERLERSEGLAFKAFYKIYKFLFRILTGKSISFGNFSIIPMRQLRALLYIPAVWNNLAASILRSGLPVVRVPTRRGHRYAGGSSMNLVSLVLHGLSAIAVFADTLFVRMLFLCLGVATLSALSVTVVIGIRLLTDLATPGWATTIVMALAIISLQAVIIAMSSAFLVLNSRSTIPVVWGQRALEFVADRVPILVDKTQ